MRVFLYKPFDPGFTDEGPLVLLEVKEFKMEFSRPSMAVPVGTPSYSDHGPEYRFTEFQCPFSFLIRDAIPGKVRCFRIMGYVIRKPILRIKIAGEVFILKSHQPDRDPIMGFIV